MLRKLEWKIILGGLKKKWSNLWVIKEIKADGRVEI